MFIVLLYVLWISKLSDDASSLPHRNNQPHIQSDLEKIVNKPVKRDGNRKICAMEIRCICWIIFQALWRCAMCCSCCRKNNPMFKRLKQMDFRSVDTAKTNRDRDIEGIQYVLLTYIYFNTIMKMAKWKFTAYFQCAIVSLNGNDSLFTFYVRYFIPFFVLVLSLHSLYTVHIVVVRCTTHFTI